MSCGSVAQSVGFFGSLCNSGRCFISRLQFENICNLGEPFASVLSSSLMASQPASQSLLDCASDSPASPNRIALLLPVSWLLFHKSGGASVR